MAGSENGSGGWPYRFELIPLDDLFVDPTYQRPLSSFAERIKRNYNPAMVGTLVVSERNDRRRKANYAVVDGQTRMYGMGENGEPVAPCLVYTDLTPADEAKLFADLQTQRRGMATSLRFRAALLSGDGEAQTIAAIARAVGMKMAGDEDMSGIKSIAAVEWLYRKDPTLLRRVLEIVSAAWPDEAPPVGSTVQDPRTRGEILKGIGRFILEQDPDDERLTERLSRVSPSQLRHRANALREGSGSSGSWDRYVREAMIGVYARGRRSRGNS
jgi:hypothetical protein